MKLSPYISHFASALISAVCLAGCATTEAPPPKVAAAPLAGAPAEPLPAPGTAELVAKVRLKREEFTPGTPAEYAVTFENPSADAESHFEASTAFLGANDAEITRTAWRRIDIAAGQRHPYAALSTSPGISSARLYIRLLEEKH